MPYSCLYRWKNAIHFPRKVIASPFFYCALWPQNGTHSRVRVMPSIRNVGAQNISLAMKKKKKKKTDIVLNCFKMQLNLVAHVNMFHFSFVLGSFVCVCVCVSLDGMQ